MYGLKWTMPKTVRSLELLLFGNLFICLWWYNRKISASSSFNIYHLPSTWMATIKI